MMKIPFHPNTGDGTHCFQAALKMALAKLLPDQEFSYEYLDKISGKGEGQWTWPTKAMLWMMDLGLNIRLIEEFDYKAFVKSGLKYLIKRYGKEVAAAQADHSDIEKERKIAAKFVELAPIEYRIPDFADIEQMISDGGIVLVNLNSAALHGLPGYSGHFVVICDITSENVILHDPGMPPYPEHRVKKSVFERAWGYPKDSDRNLMCISLK